MLTLKRSSELRPTSPRGAWERLLPTDRFSLLSGIAGKQYTDQQRARFARWAFRHLPDDLQEALVRTFDPKMCAFRSLAYAPLFHLVRPDEATLMKRREDPVGWWRDLPVPGRRLHLEVLLRRFGLLLSPEVREGIEENLGRYTVTKYNRLPDFIQHLLLSPSVSARLD